jgi:endoglucanase
MTTRAARASGFATPDLALLRRLTDAVSVSGDEGAVRAIVADEVCPVADDLHEDPLGNLLVVRRGAGPRRLRVMVAAHMDEVGIMILGTDADGRFFFDSVGHLDPAQLPGKVLWIGPERVPGVIGAPPPHLLESDERAHPFPIEHLRIDIGETTREAALERVRPGMWASYATPFQRSGNVVMARALDDRIGVASLVDLVRRPPRGIELLAAFTAQEETGGRGARVAAQAFEPDCALVLDCTAARDILPDDDARLHRVNARLGEGPVVYVADGSAVYDPRWIAHLRATAESRGIPYQIRQPAGGGTDAGVIHLAGQGIPCGAVSVPTRNLHGTASLSLLSDWRGSMHLVHAALASLTPAILRR